MGQNTWTLDRYKLKITLENVITKPSVSHEAKDIRNDPGFCSHTAQVLILALLLIISVHLDDLFHPASIFYVKLIVLVK